MVNKFLNETLAQLDKKLQRRKEQCSAQKPPSYSDILIWTYNEYWIENSRRCLSLVLAFSLLGVNTLQERDFRERIARICLKYNQEGQWAEIYEIVNLTSFAPGSVINKILSKHSTEEYFGNILRLSIRCYEQFDVRPYEIKQTGFVKRPKRKRGYDDKGSLRAKHLTPKGKMLKEKKVQQEINIPISENFFFDSIFPERNLILSEDVESTTSSKVSKELKVKLRRFRKRLERNNFFIDQSNSSFMRILKNLSALESIESTEYFEEQRPEYLKAVEALLQLAYDYSDTDLSDLLVELFDLLET